MLHYGNCLTAAWRKRHQGVLTMTWCFNRLLPHFYVRIYQRGVQLDIRPRLWKGTIRFLGDDVLGLQGLQRLWFAYEDIEKPLPFWGSESRVRQ